MVLPPSSLAMACQHQRTRPQVTGASSYYHRGFYLQTGGQHDSFNGFYMMTDENGWAVASTKLLADMGSVFHLVSRGDYSANSILLGSFSLGMFIEPTIY